MRWLFFLAFLLTPQQTGNLSCTCVATGQTGPLWMSAVAAQAGGTLVWGYSADMQGPVLLIVCKGREGMNVAHGYAQIDVDLSSGQLRVVNVQPPPAGFQCP